MKPVLGPHAAGALCPAPTNQCWRSAPAAATWPPASGRLAREVVASNAMPTSPMPRALSRLAAGHRQRARRGRRRLRLGCPRTFDAICVTAPSTACRNSSCHQAQARRAPVHDDRPFSDDGSGAGASRRQQRASNRCSETGLPTWPAPRRYPNSTCSPPRPIPRQRTPCCVAARFRPRHRPARSRADRLTCWRATKGATAATAVRRRRIAAFDRRRTPDPGARPALPQLGSSVGVTRNDRVGRQFAQRFLGPEPAAVGVRLRQLHRAARGKSLDRAGGFDLGRPAEPDHAHLLRVLHVLLVQLETLTAARNRGNRAENSSISPASASRSAWRRSPTSMKPAPGTTPRAPAPSCRATRSGTPTGRWSEDHRQPGRLAEGPAERLQTVAAGPAGRGSLGRHRDREQPVAQARRATLDAAGPTSAPARSGPITRPGPERLLPARR